MEIGLLEVEILLVLARVLLMVTYGSYFSRWRPNAKNSEMTPRLNFNFTTSKMNYNNKKGPLKKRTGVGISTGLLVLCSALCV